MTDRLRRRDASLGICATLAAALLAAPALADCPADLPRAEYSACLIEAERLSTAELAAFVEAAKGAIDLRTDVFDTQKPRWKTALADAQSTWLRLRNQECQELALFESGAAGKSVAQRRADLFTARLACLIRANRRRLQDLDERYGAR